MMSSRVDPHCVVGLVAVRVRESELGWKVRLDFTVEGISDVELDFSFFLFFFFFLPLFILFLQFSSLLLNQKHVAHFNM